jgi:hypothetical protein
MRANIFGVDADQQRHERPHRKREGRSVEQEQRVEGGVKGKEHRIVEQVEQRPHPDQFRPQ